MKLNVKLLGLVLAMGMVASSALVGCNNQNKDKDQPEATTKQGESTTQAAEEKTLKPLTLNIFAVSPGKQKDHDKVIAEANKKLQELLPNTTIEMELVTNAEFKQKFDLKMAGIETVDVVTKAGSAPLAIEVEKGSLIGLNSLIDEYAPDIKKEIPAWLLEGGLVKDEMYMVPKYEMHFWQFALFSQKALFEKYFDLAKAKEVFDVDQEYIVATKDMYDVMEDYMKKLKDAGELRKGFSPYMFFMSAGHDIIGGAPAFSYRMPVAGRLYTPGNEWDLTLQNVYKMPETIEMFKTYADWRQKGYIREDMLSLQNPREDERSDTDGYTVWFHAYQNPKMEGDYYTESRWKEENVRYQIQKVARVNTNYNDGLAITMTAQDPARSMMLIDLLTTEKGKDFYNTLVYGIEGEHYKKVSENRVETIGYAGQGTAEAPYGQYKWALGNVHNAYVTQVDPVDDYRPYWNTMHESGLKNIYASFKYAPSETMVEIAQIKTVIGQYVRAFMCGYYDEAKYAEFLEKLEQAGVEKVLADVQSQFDEYLKSQNIPKTGYKQ